MTAITLAEATQLLGACEDSARAEGVAAAMAVVDAGGHLIAFRRMDGAPFGTVRFSERKAASAAALGVPTIGLAQAVTAVPGLISAAEDGIAFVAGGVPLRKDGTLVGGLGVAGGVNEQDHALATAALTGWKA